MTENTEEIEKSAVSFVNTAIGRKKQSSAESYVKIQKNKQLINKILSTFIDRSDIGSCSSVSKDYNPQNSIQAIKEYMKENADVHRLPYSEITTSIFSLNDEDKGIILTNAMKLYGYVQSGPKIEYKDIVFKLYDHIQLACCQIDKIEKELDASVKKAKEDFEKETIKINETSQKDIMVRTSRALKNSEREYITILGIFAAIVLAATSGLMHVNSLLSNIQSESTRSLLIIGIFMAIFIINIIGLLLRFLSQINEKKINMLGFWKSNIVIVVIGMFLYYIAR